MRKKKLGLISILLAIFILIKLDIEFVSTLMWLIVTNLLRFQGLNIFNFPWNNSFQFWFNSSQATVKKNERKWRKQIPEMKSMKWLVIPLANSSQLVQISTFPFKYSRPQINVWSGCQLTLAWCWQESLCVQICIFVAPNSIRWIWKKENFLIGLCNDQWESRKYS